MKHLVDSDLAKSILETTFVILRENFNYDIDTTIAFHKAFLKNLNEAHTDLIVNGTERFKRQIWGDPDAKLFFTISFTGFHITKTLKERMDFSFQELDLFNNLISKYIKIEDVET